RRAMTILEALTKQKPVQIHAKRSIREWNIHKKEPIACKVTLRNECAMNFLSKALEAIDNQLKITRFDKYGNFGFGIHEHITLEMDGSKYDPNLGIIGMDILVSFSRAGYRIAKRQYLKKKIPKSQRIKPEEAMTLLNQDFGVEIITSEEEDEL
ncbi:MAG: 50S ribosomal protein L5, partial [Thermodesulfovibrionia bacterium]|nr:50S ribosomal protein L5 [Thermodesulfovibrionia bacterium]